MVEDRYYGLVADEISRGVLDPALRARAVADSGGDQQKAEARYITLRARKLQKQERESTRLERAAKRAASEAARKADLTGKPTAACTNCGCRLDAEALACPKCGIDVPSIGWRRPQ